MAVSALGQAETMTADGAVCSERHAGVSCCAHLFVCWYSHQQRPRIGREAQGLVERHPQGRELDCPSRHARPILVRGGPPVPPTTPSTNLTGGLVFSIRTRSRPA
jgi:hypothetical protein